MWATQAHQHTLEVTNMPPGAGIRWVTSYSTQFTAVAGLVFLQFFLLKLEQFLIQIGKVRGRKRSEKDELLAEMSKSIAKAYNTGDGLRGTGVNFDDVQVSCIPLPFHAPLVLYTSQILFGTTPNHFRYLLS
jgi:hypothetical protein